MQSSSYHWITACILVLTPMLPSPYLLTAASSGQIQTELKQYIKHRSYLM